MDVPQSVLPIGAVPLCFKHLTTHTGSGFFVNLAIYKNIASISVTFLMCV